MSQIILKNKVLIVANTNNFKNNIKKIKKFISLYNPSIISLNPNTNIDSEKIDYIIACNDIRIYADLKKYLNINSRIVLPFRNIDKNILKKLKKNKFINIESNFLATQILDLTIIQFFYRKNYQCHMRYLFVI